MNELTPVIGDMITLTLEDGKDYDFIVNAVFSVGDKDYIAIYPDSEKPEEVYFYGYHFEGNREEDFVLDYIEDDDVLEAVIDAYDELEDAEEFDELFDGE